MAVETFNYQRQAGAQGKITYRVVNTQFGDGYSESIADGINNKVQEWPLSFEGGINDVKPVLDFFDRHAGSKSFYWTPPAGSDPLLFRVSEVNFTSMGGGVYRVSANFKQVFSL